MLHKAKIRTVLYKSLMGSAIEFSLWLVRAEITSTNLRFLLLQQFFGIVRQSGYQNDHPTMPTFLLLYRILSIYRLIKPPKFGNCSVEDTISERSSPLSIDEFKVIFTGKEPVEEAHITKLSLQIESLVEEDDWGEEKLLALDFSAGELQDVILYYACGYLCRRLIKRFSKCEVCKNSFLTKLDPNELEVAEIVTVKNKGYLLNCNIYLFNILRRTENYFVKNVKSSNVYEKTLCDVFENIDLLTFPCTEHKSDVLAASLHYFILMRMRQYEREQNRSLKKQSRRKKKLAKLCKS